MCSRRERKSEVCPFPRRDNENEKASELFLRTVSEAFYANLHFKKGVKITAKDICQSDQHINTGIVGALFYLTEGTGSDVDPVQLKLCNNIYASEFSAYS